MPVIGKDKEATEEAKRRMQERNEAIKQEIDKLREELLKTKDKPLNERPKIEKTVPIELVYPYPLPGFARQHSREFIENLKKSIVAPYGAGILHKPICTLDFGSIMPIINTAEKLGSIDVLIWCVVGNARLQAAKELGFSEIKVDMEYLTIDEAYQIRVIENEEREEENPMDLAELFDGWIKTTNITQTEIAKKFGKTQPWVAQRLMLLKLPKKVQELIRAWKVSFTEALKICQIDDPETQIKLAELCAEGISENDLDAKIRQAKLKQISIMPIIPPAPIEPDTTPPRPVIPPISPTPKPPVKSDIDVVQDYLKNAIIKALEVIKGKEDKFGRLFPAKLQVFLYLTERCKGNCGNCDTVEGCRMLLRYLHQYYGISLPNYADFY